MRQMPTMVVIITSLVYLFSICAQISLQQNTFYWAVVVGHQSHIFDNWPACLDAIMNNDDGVAIEDVMMRSFDSREAANEFLRGGANPSSYGGASASGSNVQASFWAENGAPIVYTDGSSTSHGDGIGVFWGDQHPLNVREPVARSSEHAGESNRPEFYAVIRAMEVAWNAGYTQLVIRTDFEPFVDAQDNGHLDYWASHNWLNRRERHVKNEDLWKQIYALRKDFAEFRFEKVQAHSGNTGNNNADRLARIGRGDVSYYVVPNFGVYTTHKQWPMEGTVLSTRYKKLDKAINKYFEKSN